MSEVRERKGGKKERKGKEKRKREKKERKEKEKGKGKRKKKRKKKVGELLPQISSIPTLRTHRTKK